jgi:hypothetical protein
LSDFCPEIDPICFATKNIQSRFSSISSVDGISGVEDGIAAIHACTVWLANCTSRALPTHPQVHITVDRLSNSGGSVSGSSKRKNAEDNKRRHHGHSKRTTCANRFSSPYTAILLLHADRGDNKRESDARRIIERRPLHHTDDTLSLISQILGSTKGNIGWVCQSIVSNFNSYR